MTRHALILVGAGALAALALFYSLKGGHAAKLGNNDIDDLKASIERIADAQTALSQRLDRIEYRAGTGTAALPPAIPFNAGLARPADGNESKLSAAQRAALQANSVHALEDLMVRDPLSPQWASANEKTIGDFLDPGNLARQQLPVPKDAQTECHSHLCRISMTFPDPQQASRTESMLLLQIAPNMPNAQTVMVPQPDGSVQMLVFAGDTQAFRRP